MSEIKGLACNYAVSTKISSVGSLCYVLNTNPGSAGEQIEILARSRSGRWVQKWEAAWRLHNFRLKTIPDSKTMLFQRVVDFSHFTDFDVKRFNEARDRDRGRQLGNVAGLTKASV